MAVKEDTTGTLLHLVDSKTAERKARRKIRRFHHLTDDELLEDAIRLLCLLESRTISGEHVSQSLAGLR